MRMIFGLIILLISIMAYSRGRELGIASSNLLLRGRVPASHRIVWHQENYNHAPTIETNGSKIIPKVKLVTKKNQRLITITHP